MNCNASLHDVAFELDHSFILTSKGAPEADLLIDFGLSEGEANVHPGQGTANRRFFFSNAMLELLWVHDPNEAKSRLTNPTKLWERWEGGEDSTSPFGICLRSSTDFLPSFFSQPTRGEKRT